MTTPLASDNDKPTNALPQTFPQLAQPLSIETNVVQYDALDSVIPGGIAMLPVMIGGMMAAQSAEEPENAEAEPSPDSFAALFDKAVENREPVQLAIQIGAKGWILAIR